MRLVRSVKSAVSQGQFKEGQIFLIRENTIFAKVKRFLTKQYFNDCVIVVPFMNKMYCYTLLFGRFYEKGSIDWLEKVEREEVLIEKAVTLKYMKFKEIHKNWQNLQK